ncbi:DEAD/DEAH box helicase [Nocardia aurea]|uniref:DEAD/DEAH box helicase family protein n=1 Tax=Nocardia aurea TaxID=2144174 RepID=A0ABV3G4Y9_9NOCA
MSVIDGSPGIMFRELLNYAPMTYVRQQLGKDVCALLDLIEGGRAPDARLRDAAARIVDVEKQVARNTERGELLALLPVGKQTELAVRLGMTTAGSEFPDLQTLTWTVGAQRELLEFIGFTNATGPTEGLPTRIDCAPIYSLFPHQRHAATRVKELLYIGPRRVVLHLPTGVGKTRTGMNLIVDHLRSNEPTIVIWVARGDELLEQAASEFERAWSQLGNRVVPIVRMWGSASPTLDQVTDGIIVLGLEKAVSVAKADKGFLSTLAARSSLVIFDEAHQIIAPTYRGIVDALTIRPDTSLLGLTATPGRTWADVEQDEQLSNYFCRQKVTLEIGGYSNPVSALIDQGYLAKPIMRTVASNAGLVLSASDRAQLARSFDIPTKIVEQLVHDEQWNLKVIHTISELIEGEHRRILVFAASVDHCRLIAAVLSAIGIDADYVTGESSGMHRRNVIGRFKRAAQRPMVLCNFGVLTTGFDAPAASAAVIARPTKSLVLYSQMVGRVIRGPKAGGTSTCEIVTVVDPEMPGFGDVAEAFANWEDVWETA